MTPREFYNRYRYRMIKLQHEDNSDIEGIVVGYSDESFYLIIAITNEFNHGWTFQSYDDIIYDMRNNRKGYWYVGKDYIVFKM